MIGEAIALVGAVLILLGAIGVLRFPDVLSRMHALTKASTVGVPDRAADLAEGSPTALHPSIFDLIITEVRERDTTRPYTDYLARGIPSRVDTIDEFADARAGRRGPPRD